MITVEKYIEDSEARLELLQMLADSSFEAIGVFSEDLRCLAVNNAAVEVFGYSGEEMLTMTAFDFLEESSHSVMVEKAVKGVQEPYLVTGKRKDGSTFPGEVRGRNMVFGGLSVRVSAIRDISESKAAEAALRAALHEQEIIFANTKVGLMFLQGGRYLKRANQTLADILGYSGPEEMKGLDMRELHLSEELYHDFGDRYFHSLSDGAQLNIEFRLRKKDGSPVWCSLSGQAVDTEKPADLSLGVLWVIDDISERKKEQARLRRMATTDDLTGALNRKEFFRQAESIMQDENRCPSGPGVLMLDIDHFKQINDKYGHEAGDQVLSAFAARCRDTLRDGDLFARLGGEEFGIFLPGTDLGGAILLAERLRKQLAATDIHTLKGSVRCTASIGVACTSSRKVGIAELLRRADMSLYEAKSEGRNRVVFYD